MSFRDHKKNKISISDYKKHRFMINQLSFMTKLYKVFKICASSFKTSK